jgi:hypothetical protein
MFVKLVLLISFFDAFFWKRNQREILPFLISFLIKKHWVILALFGNFEANRAKNGSKHQKRIL